MHCYFFVLCVYVELFAGRLYSINISCKAWGRACSEVIAEKGCWCKFKQYGNNKLAFDNQFFYCQIIPVVVLNCWTSTRVCSPPFPNQHGKLMNEAFKVRYKDVGMTALMKACGRGHLQVTEILLSNGAATEIKTEVYRERMYIRHVNYIYF